MLLRVAASFILIISTRQQVKGQQSVRESDFYPIIEYWKAQDYRPNQLCDDEVHTVETTYPTRSSFGLRFLSQELLTQYEAGAGSLSTKDLIYTASQRRKSNDWSYLTNVAMSGTIAAARGVSASAEMGFGSRLCDSLLGQPAEIFCQTMGNFSKSTHCLGDYVYEAEDAAAAELSPENDFGWIPIETRCLASISASRDNPLSLSVQRFAYTPMALAAGVAMSERQTYYLLLKAIDHLQRFAESEYLRAMKEVRAGGYPMVPSRDQVQGENIGIHDLFYSPRVFSEIIPEWRTERVLMINEPRFFDGPTLRTPFGIIASRGNDLLIVFRKPMTTFETRLALYNQLSFKFLNNFVGEVHDGASTIFQTLSGVLEFAVEAFYKKAFSTDPASVTPFRVTFAGADLPGSGGAIILANHINNVLSEKYGVENVQTTAVAFGSRLIGDRSFIENVRQKIEIRNVFVQGDSTDAFPCARTVSCDERVLLPRTGIETGREYLYEPLPGENMITLAELARFDTQWGEESSFLQLAAIKDCAYTCFFAASVCPEDADSRCSPQQCRSFV